MFKWENEYFAAKGVSPLLALAETASGIKNDKLIPLKM